MQIQGLEIWKSATERLKELSFPAMKLSALIVREKKIIVANTAFYPNIGNFHVFFIYNFVYNLVFIFLGSSDYSCLILKVV